MANFSMFTMMRMILIIMTVAMIMEQTIVNIHMLPLVTAATTAAGVSFLKAKSAEANVIVLPSGLLYKEIQAGTGKTPTLNSPCSCHYSGTLTDGTEFDSSYRRGKPSTFAPNQVIKGWTEAMQLMKEGGKWELYIPSELAYGDRGAAGGKIPPGSVLIFTLELLEVLGDSTEL
jgi:FKBP-type peptidyl-prolyl cis-trans isomerase FklB